jgi:hypothetical protein
VKLAHSVQGVDRQQGVADYDRVARPFVRKDLACGDHGCELRHVVGDVPQEQAGGNEFTRRGGYDNTGPRGAWEIRVTIIARRPVEACEEGGRVQHLRVPGYRTRSREVTIGGFTPGRRLTSTARSQDNVTRYTNDRWQDERTAE